MNACPDPASLESSPLLLPGAAVLPALPGVAALPDVAALSAATFGQGLSSPAAGGWRLAPDWQSLRRGAWRLEQGDRSLGLTTAEQALLACLLRAAERSAHGCAACDADTLTQAVLDVWRASGRKRRRTTANLRVTIGRLRTRARLAGLRLRVRFDAAAGCWIWEP